VGALDAASNGAVVGTETEQGRAAPSRVAVVRVTPEVDCGRFPAKGVLGDTLRVGAVVVCDGHERLAAALRYRRGGETDWHESAMAALPNDGFEGGFPLAALGRWEYTVEAWIDRFASWRAGLERKVAAGQDVGSELLEGAALVRVAARRAGAEDGRWLASRADLLADASARRAAVDAALDPRLAGLMGAHAERAGSAAHARIVDVDVERERAAAGAWYECFPRSTSPVPGRHGTLRDLEARVPYIAGMGFDVLYLPPIHPIGQAHRKGRNHALTAGPDDPGSPWAIGDASGGHTAVHPALGTLADFDRLVRVAAAHGLELALDLAFQTSPDHPWVREHPEWFRRRPDGTIQYAENPPKRYQDIYPFDFEGAAWSTLWAALREVVLFWAARGVRIFRVDNPHTKPFPFWEWLIREVRARYPEVVFLAEAFTRPAVMQQLAKLGFSQSYTYFTWRNTKRELTEYLTELACTDVRDYMRPNLFVNTPDILHEYLQTGGRPAFQVRLVLAATLSATYGVYGPPFELAVTDAVPGTEEYLDSEKYAVRHWEVARPDSLHALVTRVNAIRRESPALGHRGRLRFLPVDDDQLIAYLRVTPELDDVLVVVVNLDPHHAHSGHVELPLDVLGIDPASGYQADDLLGGARYLWHGARNFVALDPHALPAHVFRLRRRVRTERDFDYFL
jgi:starch synthase (maltosyl-transferring)